MFTEGTEITYVSTSAMMKVTHQPASASEAKEMTKMLKVFTSDRINDREVTQIQRMTKLFGETRANQLVNTVWAVAYQMPA